MFILSGSGWNCWGIDSHVLRPIMTTFLFSGLVVALVNLAKSARSFLNHTSIYMVGEGNFKEKCSLTKKLLEKNTLIAKGWSH